MPEKALSQRSWLKWVLIGAGWTLFALFFASEIVITRAYLGGPLGGTRIVGNGGGGPGVNAMFRIYFERGYTVVVLSNYDPPSAERIAEKINEMITAN